MIELGTGRAGTLESGRQRRTACPPFLHKIGIGKVQAVLFKVGLPFGFVPAVTGAHEIIVDALIS